jgi:DNA-binding NarL/FixJ family response regulator
MKILFFSSSLDTIDEWLKRDTNEYEKITCYDIDSLQVELKNSPEAVVVADYDSIAFEINKLISSNTLAAYTVVLERTPEIATGKMLISHGIKAYGNSRMLALHYNQMIQTVQSAKVWTYPELTSALIKESKKPTISDDAKHLVDTRLSSKEKEVLYLVLEGLTNDAIASELEITPRTIKAHMSSIFSKLHVNDRLSLVLLLK